MTTMISNRRRTTFWAMAALGLALTGAALWWSASSRAASLQAGKPITIVVTFPPGGGTDLLARRLGAALHDQLGQTVVVDNRPGASGNIGARVVAEAEGDGSTLLMVNSSFAINPGVFQKLDFDPRRDFKPVFNVGNIASVLVVPQTSPVRALADLRTASDAPVAFASCGNGTPQHLAGEMLARATGLHLQQVPYKGCGPAITDVASGQVPLGVVTASSAAPLIAAGRVRAIAVTSAARVPQMPDVPTVAEQGAPGYALEQWHGLLAPVATPDAVVQQLHDMLDHIASEPALQQALREQGYLPVRQSVREFGQLIAADMDRYAALTRSLGLRVD